ncbi:MAG TPA: phosphoadenylyl-sulfate reductase, partial [Phototrophicaceae bacterium]|nr:phosphoadenylyl-sulfate reductase [Phototrophicaceae bacterium]
MNYTEAVLQEFNRDFSLADPSDILKWAVQSFDDKLAVVTSFQPTGIVTMHMLSQFAPDTAILTLDTGLLFPETYALMDDLEQRLNLNLIRVKPEQTVQQQEERYGTALWERDADACCNLRKVVPLASALGGYDAWIAGLRRDQNGRANIPIVSWDRKNQKVKLSPFANWSEGMIWQYIDRYDLPYNALHDQGYPSIGCKPESCTSPSNGGDNERSGRWANQGKNECGIHVA